MQYLKKLFVGFMLVATFFIFSPLPFAHAQSASCPYPGCFSGYSLPFMYECTCDPYYSWMFFFPFNTNGVTTGAAMSVPAAVEFQEYMTSPSQKYVGTYIPGVQGCYIYIGYSCVPLPSYGTMYEYTGVSQVGPFY